MPAFAHAGYQGVQLSEIARDVGVTPNLIHHYFPGGKREPYLAAVHRACSELGGLLDVDPAAELAQKMPANIAAYLDQILEPSPFYALYALAARSADDE